MISENQPGILQGYPLPRSSPPLCVVVVVIAVNVLGERLLEQEAAGVTARTCSRRGLRRAAADPRRGNRAARRRPRHPARRGGRAGRRVRLGQVDDRPRDRPAAAAGARPRARSRSTAPREPAATARSCAATAARSP